MSETSGLGGIAGAGRLRGRGDSLQPSDGLAVTGPCRRELLDLEAGAVGLLLREGELLLRLALAPVSLPAEREPQISQPSPIPRAKARTIQRRISPATYNMAQTPWTMSSMRRLRALFSGVSFGTNGSSSPRPRVVRSSAGTSRPTR